MSMLEPGFTLAEASQAIAEGLSPLAITRQCLDRIAALEPGLHAFITVTVDRALAAAEQAEKEIRGGRRRGPLHGVPYALKDLFDVAGIRTTAHSRLLLDNMASADSEATRRLEAAGMVLLGKLSTHEFARGGPTDKLPFPNARNPWATDRFVGGSSTGSAVSVAAGMVPLAMGSDTGGSVRIPAAYTNLVGLKPTYGRISRRGMVPLSFGLDHAGPLTRSVEDAALALTVLAGHDPADPGSAPVEVDDYLAGLKRGIAGLRIGYARAFNEESLVGPEQMAAMDEAVRVMRDLGATVKEVTLPSRRRLDACIWTILHAEGFAVHQKHLQTRPQDYGRVTRERLMLGAFVTGSEYVQAQRLRGVLRREVDNVLRDVDVIFCASIPAEAPLVAAVDEGPWRREHPITGPFNATGHPAMSLPTGFSANGLPLSGQLVGAHFDEATLFRIGHAYEQQAGWWKRRPPV
jgi:aspartyl-tRNA(Asn)/glutamyl-tRNA(Gln) amidotransferase subunit A